MKRSIGVTIIGWAIVSLALFSSISFFRNLIINKGYLTYLFLIYSVCLLFVGIGILILKNWARIFLFWLIVIKFLDIFLRSIPYLLKAHTRIIGLVDLASILIPGIFLLWFFNRKSVKEEFSR